MSKCNDQDIEIKKIGEKIQKGNLMTTLMPVIVGVLSMINKGTHKQIIKMRITSRIFEIKEIGLGITTYLLRTVL